MDIVRIDDYLTLLSQFLETPRSALERFYGELCAEKSFLREFNDKVRDVPSFNGKQFEHVSELHAYRSMLYLFTRATAPQTFVETGVLNGFSSAFILLAMQHNRAGRLISIDLPSDDPVIIAQGTTELPKDQSTGWAIPNSLRSRHDLRLGPAQLLLPAALDELKQIEAFLHDSDHCYTHMMFELALSWPYVRPGGWVLCDNVEQNEAFADFTRATGSRKMVVNSYLRPDRTWQHGITQKAKS